MEKAQTIEELFSFGDEMDEDEAIGIVEDNLVVGRRRFKCFGEVKNIMEHRWCSTKWILFRGGIIDSDGFHPDGTSWALPFDVGLTENQYDGWIYSQPLMFEVESKVVEETVWVKK